MLSLYSIESNSNKYVSRLLNVLQKDHNLPNHQHTITPSHHNGKYYINKLSFSNQEATKIHKIVHNKSYFLLITAVKYINKYLQDSMLAIIQQIIKAHGLKKQVMLEVIYSSNNTINMVKIFLGKKTLCIFPFTTSKSNNMVLLREDGSLLIPQVINLSRGIGKPCVYRKISSRFGYRVLRDKRNHNKILRKAFHRGIDMPLKTGTPIVSSANGIVYKSSYVNGYGKLIIIKHSNGFETRYAHLNRIFVKPGQQVQYGQKIGESGSTGFATGPHLHFEIRKNNIPLNPLHRHIIFKELETNPKLIELHIRLQHKIYEQIKLSS